MLIASLSLIEYACVIKSNSNNGGTKIKDKVIKSKENRMVTIPGNTPHVVVRHTDNNIGRFVINFNY